jgi:hypothetical protein
MKILTPDKIRQISHDIYWEVPVEDVSNLLQAQAELTREEICQKINRQIDTGEVVVTKARPSSGTIEYPYLPIRFTDFYRDGIYKTYIGGHWFIEKGIECVCEFHPEVTKFRRLNDN